MGSEFCQANCRRQRRYRSEKSGRKGVSGGPVRAVEARWSERVSTVKGKHVSGQYAPGPLFSEGNAAPDLISLDEPIDPGQHTLILAQASSSLQPSAATPLDPLRLLFSLRSTRIPQLLCDNVLQQFRSSRWGLHPSASAMTLGRPETPVRFIITAGVRHHASVKTGEIHGICDNRSFSGVIPAKHRLAGIQAPGDLGSRTGA